MANAGKHLNPVLWKHGAGFFITGMKSNFVLTYSVYTAIVVFTDENRLWKIRTMDFNFAQFIRLVRVRADSANVEVSLPSARVSLNDTIWKSECKSGYEAMDMALLPVLEALYPSITCLEHLKLHGTYSCVSEREDAFDYSCDLHEMYQMLMKIMKIANDGNSWVLDRLDLDTKREIIERTVPHEGIVDAFVDGFGPENVYFQDDRLVFRDIDDLNNPDYYKGIVNFYFTHLGKRYNGYIGGMVDDLTIKLRSQFMCMRRLSGQAKNSASVDVGLLANFVISELSKRTKDIC